MRHRNTLPALIAALAGSEVHGRHGGGMAMPLTLASPICHAFFIL